MHTDNYIQESVELLKQMVSIPSPSFKESMVREHISNWLTDKKICHEVKTNVDAVRPYRHGISRKRLFLRPV